jgi:hypothetical protein
MAKEEHKKEIGSEGKGKESGKKPKKELHAITTTKADDGSFVHEHHYKGKGGEHEPPRFGGTSSNMADLHDHMEDHFGDQAESNEGEEGEQPDQEQGGEQPGAPNSGGQ